MTIFTYENCVSEHTFYHYFSQKLRIYAQTLKDYRIEAALARLFIYFIG